MQASHLVGIMATVKLNYSIGLVSAIAALAGLLFGFDTGIISGALLFIQKDFLLNSGVSELVVSSVLIGAMAGSLLSGRLTDGLGRRKVMLVISGLFIVGTLLASFAWGIVTLILGRIILGFAIGIGSYAAPLYIAEAAPFQWRGGLVTLNQLAITIGILSAYIVSYIFVDTQDSWRWMFLVGIIPAIFLAVGMAFLPESPRWLIKQQRLLEARKTLEYLRNSKHVEQEIQEIQKSLDHKTIGFRELFAPWIRPVLLLGIFLGFLQQVTGINTVIYYAPHIFQMAGFQDASTAILATIGVGALNVVATIGAIFFIDKLGRRPLLFVGLVGMGLSLLFLSFAFQLHEMADYMRYCVLAGLLAYVVCFAMSLGALLWLMVSEIFPLEVRGLAMSLAVFSCWFWNFVVSSSFLSMVDNLGISGTFLFYACMCALGLVISYFKVPETKSVSLETIENNIRARVPVRMIGLAQEP